jgi:hypothetical protein
MRSGNRLIHGAGNRDNRHRAAPVPMTRERPLPADPIGLAVVERYVDGGVRRSKINMSYPLTARRRAAMARTARAEERARKLAPIIKAILAKGVTSSASVHERYGPRSPRSSPARAARSLASHFGFHSRAIFCASAICAGVIFAATLSRAFAASWSPLSDMCAVTESCGTPRPLRYRFPSPA